MISNNSGYKLRASKSSREVQEYDYGNSDDNYDHGVDEEIKSSAYLKDSRSNKGGSGRTRSTEFRSSKISDRRGGPRSRGSGLPGRKDYSDNFYKRNFDSRNSEVLGSRGKFYEPEKKTEIKLNLPEDTRISKLLRRLNIETDQDNSLAISKKLLEVLLIPDNAHYVRKAFHILGESMYEILHVSPGPMAKREAARALGRMGYIMGQENDFERYQHWLFNKMTNNFEEMQILLMKSLKETLAFEEKKPVLQSHTENLINNLVLAIETTENAEVFKAILDVLITVVEMYQAEFYDQFRDTIDLLFGWHVDHTQPLCNIEFISKCLQRISHHFKYYSEFSIQLIENFLEDISNYSTQIKEAGDTNSLDHVTVLILAMNTVLKCLGTTFHPINNKIVTVEFINSSLTRIIKTVTDTLENYVPENLTIAGNNCIGLLLGYLDTKSQFLCSQIYALIDLEISMLSDLSDATVISLLVLISKVVKELSANLPIEIIDKLIGPNSEIVKLRYSPFRNIQEAVICVYQALLNLKNVSLLQEAYRYVLGDLEKAYSQIVPSIQPFTTNNPFINYSEPRDPEETTLFLLRCVSQLANASSIIVMWALKPSILELVGVSMIPHDTCLYKRAPSLQYCMLYLLFSHCKCYNHFISNSTLVNKTQEVTNIMNRFALTEGLNINDVPNKSPNSGNFAIILDIIYNAISAETSNDILLLLLQWLNDVLINSEIYLEHLYINEKFSKMVDSLVRCGYCFNDKIVLAVYANLDKLLSNKQLSWSYNFLSNISDLCKLHINSNKPEIRKCYTKLSSNIPWDIAVVELNKLNSIYSMKQKSTHLKEYNNYMVYLAQHLHLNGSVDGELYPLHFKTLMKYLLNSEKLQSNWMNEIFTSCWAIESDSQMNMELFFELVVNNRQILNNWLTLEAAEFCVNYKLRTPLGKPNETFTKIESSLNSLGNELIMFKKTTEKLPESTVRSDGNRVRMLLRFVENLEKAIYNASEGCAISMPPASKVVRSFFIANTNTCHEWFCRIRIVLMHVALHCGEINIALRNGLCFLKECVSLGRVSTIEFERVAMIVTLTMLHLKEPEALYGLYSWCKTVVGKRYPWMKCASEQCSKKYETAVEGYKRILQEQNTSDESDDGNKLDSDIHNFILDQIIVCYKEMSNWIDLFEWHTAQDNVENGRKYWFNVTDWETNKILFDMESQNLAFEELSTWSFKSKDTWSIYENVCTTESNLYNVAVKLALRKDQNYIPEIDSIMSNIQNNIEDHLHLAPSEFLQNFSLLHYVGNGLKNIAQGNLAHTVFLVSESFENEIHKIDSSVLRKILWWSEYFGRVQNQGFNVFCSNLRLDIIKRSRKEKNFQMAIKQIHKFFNDKDLVMAGELNIVDITNTFMHKIQDINVWTVDVARAVFEVIKLSYSYEQNHQQTFNLCAAASTAISKYAELFGINELRKISSKILLKLSSWLQTNEGVSLTEMNSPLGKLVLVLPEIGMVESHNTNIIPLNEIAIGKLLQFSVHHYGSLAKSWNAFGTWCYRWGKKIVDHSSDIKNNLSEEHCLEIKKLLPPDTPEEDLNKIFIILSQTRNIIDEEDIDSNEIKTSEMIQSQLQCVGILEDAVEHQLQSLIQIWKSTQKRIYHYYALSAEAYFKYLQLVLQSENVTKNTECNTITVTLRLLRLIVKYALELQNILEEGLQTTPTHPWKVIIPQLFSRLNHPESYVRLRVSDLLCRVAEDAPHLITFPAVVGALEGGLKFDFSEITLPKDCLSQNNDSGDENELNEEDDNYDSDDNEEPISNNNSLQICFKTMVDTLSKQDPETIAQVQTLVKELRRITLLWDELWLGTLAQHQSEINKRQQQLEYEIEKVNDNTSLDKTEKASLIIEKHRIIIKPIVFVLEQLLDVTSVTAETPHEKQFQEKYLDDIVNVLKKLKDPDHPENPQESLLPLKHLQKKFQQKFHKRASYALKMQDISPVLFALKDTVISMPGLASIAKKNVTISHVSNIVSILPTKTKPKKLVFYGSDGQTYTYLFKGLEDLHLDERIMQFLSIANTMMAQIADPSGSNFYKARHYSVIPLGPRSGLISWVDGTIPVFSLYKRWQQREIAKPNSKNFGNATASVLRPSELFYNKLNPLLQEHGIKNIDNRKEWPLSTLKQVLTELMNETPSDLLSREFWCNSVSPDVWWQVIKRYSYSIAVMSIIGYIIGLGDRHLDNMLVDLTSGDVVHIDYNVCFEKGKTLRVPEKVPFRLTPNIKDALGVTGVEGIFRLACENVLKVMRKGRETLLTLLEAFVYDPLIDWTVGGEVLAGTTFGALNTDMTSKQSKKELEREVTLAMFNVRCTEMRAEWNENKEEVLNEIPNIIKNLNEYLELNSKVAEIEDKLQDLHQQLALIKEAEAQGAHNHSLYSLPSHYDAYHKSQISVNNAKSELRNIIKESEDHVNIYSKLFILYDTQQFSQWLMDVKINITEDSMRIFDLVKEFLHNAGKNDVITQCERSEQEVFQLLQLLNISVRKCLQIYQDYFLILTQCPKSYLDSHRIYMYIKWSKFLLETHDFASCDVIYEQLREFLDNSALMHPQIVTVAYNLETFYKDNLMNVNKLFGDLEAIRSKDSNESLEKVYKDAKAGINTFINMEKGAVSALEFVIASELVLLNRNLLTLEIAAQRSGDWLIKLTSRDGDWFLDDLLLHSTKAVEMISNLPTLKQTYNESFYKVLSGIKIASNIYKGLYDLNFNFHTIILLETMKKMQAEEPSVIELVNDLNKVVADIGVSIPDMIGQLEKLLTCVLMQMDYNNTYDFILERVAFTKKQFLTLIPNQSEMLSQGKMLLMGFNGLFDKLSQEITNLTNTLGNLDIPKSWKRLDHVKDARNIAPHIFNVQVRNLLEDIFFLKRLKTIVEFFGLVQEMCQSLKGIGSGIIFSDEQLTKPVKQFIAEFISRKLLGILPEIITYSVCFLLQNLGLDVTHEIEQKDIGAESKVPLDELYTKAYSILLKDGIFSQNILSQASSLETNLKLAWEKIQEPKKIEQKLTVLQSSTLRLQGQLAVHNMMFDEVLKLQNFSSVRTKFTVDIQSEVNNLQSIYRQLVEAKNNQEKLIEKADQRLNWAKGANPNVVEISAAFESAVANRNAQLDLGLQVANHILSSCSTVLKHEFLRSSNSEVTKEHDKIFLKAFETWRLACQYIDSKTESLSPSEESILKMLTPDLVSDAKWLQKVSETLTDTITMGQKELIDKREASFTDVENLVSMMDNFKTIYNIHGKLISDVKGLMKIMTKIEEYSVATQYFMQEYRLYIDHFSSLFNHFKKDLNKEEIQVLLNHLFYIRDHTETIYENLLNLESAQKRAQLIKQKLFSESLEKSVPQKQETGSKGQQRNAYAVNVWRRVKMKLEGRDLESARKSSVQEQVDHVIREATNLDNLALLYEGWTPWV
ncbi:serine/threonine-protein kinase SMG1 [Diabrotica virgifera virgifera]|uniref:non-specific serine/threonine protein kinase n=2 Tax=Diabrotica virgifera virgifera TaxID=50390 RepID=A0ABM5KX08_DIAVI|nr:serine/threonine-protein kinase SMG1 [Diabrotica virgifera virgifera]